MDQKENLKTVNIVANEYILCAAVWFEEFDNEYSSVVKHQSRPKNITTGVVICGQRHLQCLRTFSFITGKRAVVKSTQGFITNKNRFVDRAEGGKIAFSAGQTKELKQTLYSEDLY